VHVAPLAGLVHDGTELEAEAARHDVAQSAGRTWARTPVGANSQRNKQQQ
jgi:hypothetical protein